MDQKLPLRANVRWFQVAFGGFVAIVGYQLVFHFAGRDTLGQGGLIGRIMLLAVGLVVFMIYLQNIYRFGIVPDYSKKCRFCEGPVNRYSEFCEHCGADLIGEDKLVKCPKCGVDVYEGTKFCPECGGTVTKGKKGGKKGKGERPDPTGTASVGWSTPIDATTGFPPPEDERR